MEAKEKSISGVKSQLCSLMLRDEKVEDRNACQVYHPLHLTKRRLLVISPKAVLAHWWEGKNQRRVD